MTDKPIEGIPFSDGLKKAITDDPFAGVNEEDLRHERETAERNDRLRRIAHKLANTILIVDAMIKNLTDRPAYFKLYSDGSGSLYIPSDLPAEVGARIRAMMSEQIGSNRWNIHETIAREFVKHRGGEMPPQTHDVLRWCHMRLDS